jgi:ribosomal protein L15E
MNARLTFCSTVLRSFLTFQVNQDATYKYFEVILVDPQHQTIRNDPRINCQWRQRRIAHFLCRAIWGACSCVMFR